MGTSVFEREVKKFLETQCCLVIHQVDLRGPRFTIKKTVDYVCCHAGGTFWAIEVKQTKKDSFAFARIRPHQRKTLLKVSETEHGKAYLALNFRGKRDPGMAWLIPWKWFEDFTAKWPKKSITRCEAEKEFWKFQLKRVTKGWTIESRTGGIMDYSIVPLRITEHTLLDDFDEYEAHAHGWPDDLIRSALREIDRREYWATGDDVLHGLEKVFGPCDQRRHNGK